LPGLQIVAAGDRYRLALPLAGLGGEDTTITADLRPIDGQRWSATDIHLPANSVLTMRVPVPPPAGQAAGSKGTEKLRLHVTIASQDSRAQVDPTLATPSTLISALHGIAVEGETGGSRQTQRIDDYASTVVVQPLAENRMTIGASGDATGWRLAQDTPMGGALAVGARRLSGTATLAGMDRARAASLGAAIGTLAGAPTPRRDAALRAVVLALHGAMDEARFDETIEGIQIALTGLGDATMDKMRLGWDSAVPDGTLTSRVTLGVDGLSLPGLPQAAAELAPHHLVVGVSVSGLATGALETLALAALTPGATVARLSPQIDALLADPGRTGGPTLTVDTLAFDSGPARLQAHGSVVALSQTDLRGTARIAITGFDALADKVRGDPGLRSAFAFMVLARGLARAEGPTLIWDVVFTPNGLTVNGVDPRVLLPNQGGHGRQR
jgi:hypothetical protein